ncbi:MAG TPA: hypothetical protein VGI56_04555 [Galbitalea sp.]
MIASANLVPPVEDWACVSRKKLDSYAAAGVQAALAEQVALQRVDQASAVVQPENIAHLWVEQEYDELEAEQAPLWTASGLVEARSAAVHCSELAPAASVAEHLLTGHSAVIDSAATRVADTTEALAPFRHRPPNTKLFHYAAKSGFLLGDIAGISTAAIWGGEIVVIAIVMSVSAAVATVVAGLTGSQIRDLRSARRRARDVGSLTEKQVPFQHLFAAVDHGVGIVRGMIGVSISVAILIGVAIYALRFSIQGPLVGVVYGCIAVAIAAASFIESYMYADEIADQIENANHDYEKTVARHQELAHDKSWQRHRASAAEAGSIIAEHVERGNAAKYRVRSMKWGILRRNPGIAGHGPGAGSSVVGRAPRKGGMSK